MPVTTFTYTAGADTTLNSLRFEIGDTVEQTAKFDDAELNDIIDEEVSVFGSAARCFEILANRHAGDFTFAADGATFQKGNISDHYRARAADYRFKAQGADTQTSTVTRVDGHSQTVASDTVTSRAFDITRNFG